MKHVTFEDVKASEEVKAYIRQADVVLAAIGYTEHSFAHVLRCAEMASRWLLQLGYSQREAELARIAAYMHDIGNVVNRANHAMSGALLAGSLLDKMGMPIADIVEIETAIGHHDEKTAAAVTPITAALILADKTDVRRSRVRNKETISSDIHDRVNFAVEKAITALDVKARTLTLNLTIDTAICSVMDYFKIFMDRMVLCRNASDFLHIQFQLTINGVSLM